MPNVPRALLLDFGGVIVGGVHRPAWAKELAETVHTLLTARRATAPERDVLAADLAAGLDAYGRWCDAMTRPYDPVELRHEQFWSDYVAADWPPGAREIVLNHATALCQRLGEVLHAWQVRPGMAELLDAAATQGMLLAVVSNTLYGGVHRDFLERHRLADRFVVQVYSDESGVRKPNPELIWRATRSLGVSPEHSWFVGDTRGRDVRCARRARVGQAILMRSQRTDQEPLYPTVEPDEVVADPFELRRLLRL